MSGEKPEPWLRETLTDVPPVARAVLHSLEHAGEDLAKWCGGLTDEQLNRRVDGVASVAFQLRHVARSVDRLLTYAEWGVLSDQQMRALETEMDQGARREELFAELTSMLTRGAERVRALANSDLAEVRFIGRKRIKTTLGGLLVHTAEHTQRHVGQAIVIVKMVSGASNPRLY